MALSSIFGKRNNSSPSYFSGISNMWNNTVGKTVKSVAKGYQAATSWADENIWPSSYVAEKQLRTEAKELSKRRAIFNEKASETKRAVLDKYEVFLKSLRDDYGYTRRYVEEKRRAFSEQFDTALQMYLKGEKFAKPKNELEARAQAMLIPAFDEIIKKGEYDAYMNLHRTYEAQYDDIVKRVKESRSQNAGKMGRNFATTSGLALAGLAILGTLSCATPKTFEYKPTLETSVRTLENIYGNDIPAQDVISHLEKIYGADFAETLTEDAKILVHSAYSSRMSSDEERVALYRALVRSDERIAATDLETMDTEKHGVDKDKIRDMLIYVNHQHEIPTQEEIDRYTRFEGTFEKLSGLYTTEMRERNDTEESVRLIVESALEKHELEQEKVRKAESDRRKKMLDEKIAKAERLNEELKRREAAKSDVYKTDQTASVITPAEVYTMPSASPSSKPVTMKDLDDILSEKKKQGPGFMEKLMSSAYSMLTGTLTEANTYINDLLASTESNAEQLSQSLDRQLAQIANLQQTGAQRSSEAREQKEADIRARRSELGLDSGEDIEEGMKDYRKVGNTLTNRETNPDNFYKDFLDAIKGKMPHCTGSVEGRQTNDFAHYDIELGGVTHDIRVINGVEYLAVTPAYFSAFHKVETIELNGRKYYAGDLLVPLKDAPRSSFINLRTGKHEMPFID